LDLLSGFQWDALWPLWSLTFCAGGIDDRADTAPAIVRARTARVCRRGDRGYSTAVCGGEKEDRPGESRHAGDLNVSGTSLKLDRRLVFKTSALCGQRRQPLNGSAALF
jgi:hypothetical protein